ncbi:MAG TPA: hypothetical protein VGN01_15810 [Acidobacteriaceae bacterium]|jgi:hypothetical protein
MSVLRRFLLGFAVGCLLAIAFAVARAEDGAKIADASALTVGDKRYDTVKELVRMTKRYGLTEEQKARIQPILLEQQRQVHGLGEEQNLSDAEWVAEMRKVHLQAVTKLKVLLTDAQLSKYAKDEAKNAKSMEDAQADGPEGPPPDGPPPGE